MPEVGDRLAVAETVIVEWPHNEPFGVFLCERV